MRTRTTATIAVGAAAALALTACSSGDSSADGGSSEITLWMYPVIADEDASRDYWESFEADFETEHSDIDLSIELLPWADREEKIGTAIAAGTGPDLVLLVPDLARNFYDTGGLKPIDGAIDDPGVYFEGALAGGTFDGEIYGLPIYQTANTTAYNTALFEEAGITELPQTWDEILDAAPALAENGVSVLDYSGSAETTLNISFYPLLWQAGGSVFTEDGSDIAFDGPEGVEALQFLLDLQEAGGLPADAATKTTAVEGGPLGLGTAAMSYGMSGATIDQLEAAVGEENVTVGAPLTGAVQASFGTPGIIGLTTINEDEEAALEVARALAAPEAQSAMFEAAGWFPSREDAEITIEDDATQALFDSLAVSNPGEAAPGARQVMSILATHIQSALQGQATAEEAIADAAAEARDAISRL
ncbi:sugar ABC transporter substrate-binding protein [Ruania alkalisoli]|uniref:Sugar ABC transporter substrate-binding protein n=1 Tax=Ruania alkalisoli TaxID=2779775 RepID=A0A7M1SSE6_9MICO|nr:sugar ABC transporter substrate-binding protein [Ruania alkalisoli]QOR69712.1 sugar ABC transporter substrate-binding protein [Ruania alkalisoli]